MGEGSGSIEHLHIVIVTVSLARSGQVGEGQPHYSPGRHPDGPCAGFGIREIAGEVGTGETAIDAHGQLTTTSQTCTVTVSGVGHRGSVQSCTVRDFI